MNDVVVKPTSELIMEQKANRHVLRIQKARLDQAGRVAIKISNVAGEGIASCSLTVKGSLPL